MVELVKWSETNVGKYSMFDVELCGIKTTVSCDNENSRNLISLLEELKHTHATMNEENERLRKEIKSSLLLSESKKSTLALMRKQIDEILNNEIVEEPTTKVIEHHYVAKPIYGYDFVNVVRACKILGFTQKQINKHFHMSVYKALKVYVLKYSELCGPQDIFYNQFFDVGIKSRADSKKQLEIIQNHKGIFKNNKKTLNDLAKDLNVSVQSLWAYHIIKSIDFTMFDYKGNLHSFAFDLEIQSPNSRKIYKYIEAKGGVKKLKSLCKAGYKQCEVAKEWGISSASICNYLAKNGEKWSKWSTR